MPLLDLFKRATNTGANNKTDTKANAGSNMGACSVCGCGNTKTEFAEEYPVFGNYETKGISVNSEGGGLKVSYTGLLAKSGAQDVYVVVNYGDNKDWSNVKYYPMSSTGRSAFEVLLPANQGTNLNVAFKDGANNWDNNSGNNYIFSSH